MNKEPNVMQKKKANKKKHKNEKTKWRNGAATQKKNQNGDYKMPAVNKLCLKHNKNQAATTEICLNKYYKKYQKKKYFNLG